MQLSDEEIVNLSDAEFQTLVIRMLTGMIELGCKKKEEMKSIQSEIKENIQGARREGEETGTQTKDLKQNEEIDTQPEQNEQTRIQKNEERLRKLWDNCQRSNVRIIGVPEVEEEEKEIENLFEKNNEGELFQSGQGHRLPGSPGSSETPKEVGPKETHTKANHNYITQD